ncbi:MAG: SusC/RagA family TonB-linked outer membrane protein [Verrucomicrobiota bacterium]
MKKIDPKQRHRQCFVLGKMLTIMKLTALFFFIALFQVTASTYAQKTRLNLKFENEKLEKVFNKIEESSDFSIFYKNELIKNSKEVSGEFRDALVSEILDQILKDENLTYSVKDKLIMIVPKEATPAINQSSGQQQKKVSGKVTDTTGATLPGVSVVVKGTTTGIITDSEGKFALSGVPENAFLVFSFVGMKTQELPVSGKTSFSIKLEDETIGIEEVVAVGYGTVKKSDLTGSVNRVEAKMLKSQANTQLTDMISGSVPGFFIKQGTSASGETTNMQIRGQSSLFAKTNPLIVLDGVIYNGSIVDINPADIATIDILKDASASAVYGAKAASGVVIITTLKGKTGAAKINFSSTFGITESAKKIKSFDAEGFLDYRRDYLESSIPQSPYYYYNPSELPSTLSIDQWRKYSANPNADNTQEWLGRLLYSNTETKNYLAGKTIDWYDEVMRKGKRKNYDFNLSGGTKDVSYYWSLGYTNNEGVIVGDKFSTIRSRLNIDIKVADFINIGLNTQFSHIDQSAVPASLSDMYRNSPYGSKYNEDGSLNWYPSEQPIVLNPFMAYTYQDKFNNTNSLFSSLYAELKLPFGFSYKLSFQPRFSFQKDYNFMPTTFAIASGSRSDSQTYEWTIDNLIKWNKTVGIHGFDLTLLYSSEKNQYWNSYSANSDFKPNGNLSYHGLGFGTYPSVKSNDTYATGDAAMARLNYSLGGKYLLTTSVRRDGYSAFGQKYPRAYFPAVALAWQLGEEKFFKIDFINRMKLRMSWGINGNRDIGIYSALATLTSNYYYNGSAAVVGVTTDKLENSNLKWEKTEATNFGVDVSFFKDRINLSADYYISKTKDLLMNRRLPIITGFQNMTVNLGGLANRGFELTLNTVNLNSSNFSWKTNLVFSFNRNKIAKLYGNYGTYVLGGQTITGELPDYINKWFPGHSIDAIWDYKVIGVWQLNEAAAAAKVGLRPGDYKVEDVNGDGLYKEADDKQFLGYTVPRFNVGVRNDFTFLSNFTASIFIRADQGQISALPLAMHKDNNVYRNINTYATPYWTQYNSESTWGRLDAYGGVYAGGYNVYSSCSFVRIQDLSISYSIPKAIIQRIKLSNARIFGSVRNLYSFDKWADFDPESGSTPMPRTYVLGLSFEL